MNDEIKIAKAENNNFLSVMIKEWPLSPFLFCIYSVLYLYLYNVNQTSFEVIFLPLIVILLSCLFMFSLLYFITKDKIKSGLTTFLLFLGFFTFGHLHEIIIVHFEIPSGTFKPIYLFVPYIILFATALFFVMKARSRLSNLNSILNFATMTMTLILTFQAVYEKVQWQKRELPMERSLLSSLPITKDKARYPDIYYIIPDSYPNETVLKNQYCYDNSGFTDHLKSKGFIVDPSSRSNYGHTDLSLASILNSEYINYLSRQTGPDSSDWNLLKTRIQESPVISFLKGKGYSVINVSSIFGPLNTLKLADQNLLDPPGFGEFAQTLLYTTMIKAFYEFNLKRERLLTIFDTIEDMIDLKGPKFIITHLDSPHPPNVFDKNGKLPQGKPRVWIAWDRFNKKDYLEEIIFLNGKLTRLVDMVIRRSAIPPIILIQADHGPALTPPSSNLFSADPQAVFLEERFGILNALLVPERCRQKIKDGLTPVNGFRLILNCLFDTGLPMLEERNYWSVFSKPYKFKDVTERLKEIERLR